VDGNGKSTPAQSGENWGEGVSRMGKKRDGEKIPTLYTEHNRETSTAMKGSKGKRGEYG